MSKMPEGNPFVAITAITGGIITGIVVLALIFAREFVVPVVASVAWALVALGIFMGFFASRKK